MIDHTNEFQVMLIVLVTVLINSFVLGMVWEWFW